MKFVIAAIIIIGFALGGYQLYEYWGKFKDKDPSEAVATPAPAPAYVSGDSLDGLPDKLGPMLEAARRRGAAGLHDFLQSYGKQVKDPRLASIQLDYVELLSQSSPGEARHIFHDVQGRVPADSPVYGRIQQLAKTYE